MNVVIKPGGLIILLTAFATVSTTAILLYKENARARASVAIVSTPSATVNMSPLSSTAEAAPDDEELAADNWRLQAESGLVNVRWTKGPNEQWPKARQYTVQEKKGQSSWDVQSNQPLENALPKGTRILVRFWGRCKTDGVVVMVVEKQAAPYTRLNAKEVALSPQWRSYTMETYLAQALPTGWAKAGLQFGARPGVVEIAGAELITKTP